MKYKDQNNDGVIDNDDRIPMSGRFPGFEYSVNAGVSWKGFDLSLLGQGVSGKKWYTTDWDAALPPRLCSDSWYIEGMWTEEGKTYNAKHPRLYMIIWVAIRIQEQIVISREVPLYFRLKNYFDILCLKICVLE